MTAIDERAELKRIAAEAIAEMNRLTAQVVATRKRLDVVINHLLSDADSLALAAADERAEGVKQTAFVYGAVGKGTSTLAPLPDKAVVIEKLSSLVPPPLAPGKRACSNCRQPGHRAKNCPEPDRKALAEAKKKGLKTGRKK